MTMNYSLDPVTGSQSEQWLHEKYECIRQNQTRNYALLSLKIKRFHLINRAYGRNVGDIILKNIYEQIDKWLLPEEYCVRLYAGHFNLLVKLESIDQIHKRVVEVIKLIQNNPGLDLMTERLFVGVGVLQLLENIPEFHVAQFNAYLCREGSLQSKYRRSHYEIYGYSYINEGEIFVDLQDEILPAIKAGNFKLFLQPKVDLRTGKIVRAEALMRWIDPKKGMIPLSSFLPGLEENGFIRDVDLYLFEEVCKNSSSWIKDYGTQIDISTNLSRAYFEDDDFIPEYFGVFEKYNLPPESIEIEFIENIVMDHVERMKAIASKIQEIGFRSGLDDFGSGYSSFNVLANVKIDELKIDRSLFSDIHNPKELIVVKHIIDIAKELGIKSVAEGVETMDYVRQLRKLGCDYIQGYVFYRPMPVEEFKERFVVKKEQIKFE